jgi:hypothetical protein
MTRTLLVCALGLTALPPLTALTRHPPPRASDQQSSSTGDLVDLDVVALDRDGRPVTDLRASDFEIKDDGQRVEVKTFDFVTSDGLTPDGARSVVLLLDDSGVPMGGTVVVRAIASDMSVCVFAAFRFAARYAGPSHASPQLCASVPPPYRLGFQRKYTGTPSSTMIRPGQVVAVR